MAPILDSAAAVGVSVPPASPLDEIGLLAVAYAIIAAIALPIALAIRSRTAPRTRQFRIQAIPELESLLIIAMALLLPPLVLGTLESLGVFRVWYAHSFILRNAVAGLIAMTIWLAFVIVLLRKVGRDPLQSVRTKSWLRDISAGIFAFLLITPVTFGVHLVVTSLVLAFGGGIDRHPLQDFDTHTAAGVILFVLTACVVAPLMEETIFRGLLLPWARGRRFRPWLVFALAVLMLLAGRRGWHLDTTLFLIDLTLLMAFCVWGREIWRKWPSRTAASILATAALFGAMHSAVWPTPVPLTVMGIGLGILTFRCGNVRPAIVAHALFNGVSALALLRG